MEEQNSTPPNPPPGPGPEKSGQHGKDFFDELLRWQRAAVPFVSRFVTALTRFAVESSWRRILLLGLIIIITAGIIGSILEPEESPLITNKLEKPITIDVRSVPGGMMIQPNVNGKDTKPIHVKMPDLPPLVDKDDEGPSKVTADHDGLHVEKGGKEVVVDSTGVHVTSRNPDGKPVQIDIPAPPPPPELQPSAGAQHAAEQAQHAREQAEAEGRRAEALARRDEEMRDEVKSAVEDARDDLTDSITEALAKNENLNAHRRQSNALWDLFKVLLTISFAYMIAIKVSAATKQRADAMVKTAASTAERESLQRQVVEARMQMMQAQVEPHFLFNTLASVEYLIETDPQRAATMQRNLIQYLRAALPQMRENSTNLGREVDLVGAYLEILKVRMEERLKVSITVPGGLRSADFPPMMLQSLVENAIKHGLEPKAEGGAVALKAEVVDGDLYVCVEDSGLGFSPTGASTSGGGLGLANIRERLSLLYGTRGKCVIEANQPSGTRVTIVVPYQSMGKRQTPNEGSKS